MTEGDTEVRRKETRQCDGRRHGSVTGGRRWGAADGNSEVRWEGFAWKYCGGRRGGGRGRERRRGCMRGGRRMLVRKNKIAAQNCVK